MSVRAVFVLLDNLPCTNDTANETNDGASTRLLPLLSFSTLLLPPPHTSLLLPRALPILSYRYWGSDGSGFESSFELDKWHRRVLSGALDDNQHHAINPLHVQVRPLLPFPCKLNDYKYQLSRYAYGGNICVPPLETHMRLCFPRLVIT